MHTTPHVFRWHCRILLVLVLLNGLVGVLLWRGTVSLLSRALDGSIPYSPHHRLFVTILPVGRPISSYYPKYSSTDGYTKQGSPSEVWVYVRMRDKSQHTFTNYAVVTLPLRRLAMFLLLAVNLSLTLLALGLWHVPWHSLAHSSTFRSS